MIQPDKIIRSRRKTLSLSISPTGQLIVRAPMRMSEERIFAFVQEKEEWILKHKAKTEGAGLRLPPEYLDGYRLLLWGEEYTLRLCALKKLLLDHENKILYIPEENGKEKLIKWLKENAKRCFSAVCKKRATEMQTSYPSLSVNSAKTRWGSCSYNNALHFSFRLIYAPIEVIDYVVVHELSHTFHKNHSAAFWAKVEEYIPDYKKRREWLRANSWLMEIF